MLHQHRHVTLLIDLQSFLCMSTKLFKFVNGIQGHCTSASLLQCPETSVFIQHVCETNILIPDGQSIVQATAHALPQFIIPSGLSSVR